MSHNQENQLAAKSAEFVRMFRTVFELDWSYSAAAFEHWQQHYTRDVHFLHESLDDREMNWSSRDQLMRAYRDLCDELIRGGHSIDPDDDEQRE